MKVTFYGRLADVVGRELDLAVDEPCTVDELRERIVIAFPAVAEALQDSRVRACVDGELVSDDRRIEAADEVEFLAPVSGG
jgi:molybdopterin converting factor small subunit